MSIRQLLVFILLVSSQISAQQVTQQAVPILMYHGIDYIPNRYSVTPENFKKQLLKLYQKGYVTARLEDVIKKWPNLDNKKVAILRFDDSRASQFKYIKNKQNKLIIDPTCAVGILLDFYKKYPKFGKHALFCIIPKEEFHQPEYTKKKALFLLRNGMELGNHSFYHKNLIDYTPEDIDNDFGKAMGYWQDLLGKKAAHIKTIATPYGSIPRSPKTLEHLKNYRWGSQIYKPIGILYVVRKARDVELPPSDKLFDPYQLTSIEVTNDNFDEIVENLP